MASEGVQIFKLSNRAASTERSMGFVYALSGAVLTVNDNLFAVDAHYRRESVSLQRLRLSPACQRNDDGQDRHEMSARMCCQRRSLAAKPVIRDYHMLLL